MPSPQPLFEVEMRTPLDIAEPWLRFAAGTTCALQLTQSRESARKHEYKRLDSSAKVFVFASASEARRHS
jgi:hypothetical protein